MTGPRMAAVFFVYGLAFFAMGLAIALEARRTTELRLVRSLKYLAAFGLLHATVQWIDMWLLLPAPGGAWAPALRVVRLGLFAASALLLAAFGTTLLARLAPRAAWLRWIPPALVLFWLLNWPIGPHLSPLATQHWSPSAPSCLRCHDVTLPAAASPAPGPWRASVASGDIWAHYLIYLPASLFAAAAWLLQAGGFDRQGYARIARDCRWMGGTFLANALIAGLIVPPAPFAPASWLNYDRFLSVVGLPPQLFRAALAVLIAVFGVRILRVFDMEYARRLAQEQEARIAAQADALEGARRAAETAEAWNRELEGKVEDRTRELFEQVRRLAILEERDRLAREMHDSLGQVLGFVNLKARVASDLIARDRAPEAGQELEQMRTAVQGAYEEVRQAILSLRTTRDGQGLMESLRDYIARLREQTGLVVELDACAGCEFAPAVEAQVIRIVQEALTNVRRHAQATKATVQFRRTDGGTMVAVSDDGRGFDPSAVEGGRGMRFGLLTMRERAQSIGGTLSIETAPGKGTSILLWIPGGEDDGTHPRADR